MQGIKLGISLWSQGSDWPSFLAAAERADALGFEHVWMLWITLHRPGFRGEPRSKSGRFTAAARITCPWTQQRGA